MTKETLQTDFETVIGLEVHCQLSTATKMFCGCQNQFGDQPNTNVCPVCLGLPGSLPVVNESALHYAIRIGLALNCSINTFIKFDRKNYFYPDCPKNYQISQFDYPICYDGSLDIPSEEEATKKIRIHRAHLEEDAGKLIHAESGSLVDYNRTGTPLMEIVSEPDMRSPQEAYDYLNTLKLNLSYLGVSDCDMEKGSLRCDANISLRRKGETQLNTKTELKNMNSFRAVKAGLEYEIERQKKLYLAEEKVLQETRLWDEAKQITVLMRSKEEAHDYRYFPEPDLVPFTISQTLIDDVRQTLPELPKEKFERLQKDYELKAYDARIIVQDPELANFFEKCAGLYPQTKKINNWINGVVLQELNARKLTLAQMNISPKKLTDLISLVDDGLVSNLVAKDVFKIMIDTGKEAQVIISEKGLAQVSDDGALQEIVDQLIQENESIANQIRDGKESAVGFFVGLAMKKTQGKANPKKIGELIKRRLCP